MTLTSRVCSPLAASATLLIAGGWTDVPLSALDPAGPGAAPIATLWWVMFWGSMAILALMVGLALYVVLRSPDRRRPVPSRLLIIGGGLLFPLTVVTALLIYGIPTGHGLIAVPLEQRAFQVHVRGNQWWWEVRYPDVGGATLHDANEIHIPVNRPVDIHLTTSDVIHSFWVPRLGGKMDAVPGITNVMRIEADRPGVFRGQCAEFCGAQHSRMGFLLQAHEEEDLAARLNLLSSRSQEIEQASDMPGAQAFATECAHCHSLDTRQPTATTGPNLAGVADRLYLGAGWIPNEGEAIGAWIRRHQEIKPGNHMPAMDHLTDETVQQIAEFLESGR